MQRAGQAPRQAAEGRSSRSTRRRSGVQGWLPFVQHAVRVRAVALALWVLLLLGCGGVGCFVGLGWSGGWGCQRWRSLPPPCRSHTAASCPPALPSHPLCREPVGSLPITNKPLQGWEADGGRRIAAFLAEQEEDVRATMQQKLEEACSRRLARARK